MEIKNDISHKPVSPGAGGLAYFINQGQLVLKKDRVGTVSCSLT